MAAAASFALRAWLHFKSRLPLPGESQLQCQSPALFGHQIATPYFFDRLNLNRHPAPLHRKKLCMYRAVSKNTATLAPTLKGV